MKTEAGQYEKQGKGYGQAWDIMHAGITPPFYPPSLEVFQHEREVCRLKGDPIAPRALATELVERKGKGGSKA